MDRYPTGDQQPPQPRGNRRLAARTMWRTAVVVLLLALMGTTIVHLDSQSARSHAALESVGLTVYHGSSRLPLPDLTGTSLTSTPISTQSLRGHVVVLNVWGSWCAPCRLEAPGLARVSNTTAHEGVRFLGIDEQDNVDAGLAFERAFGITYPSFNDQTGSVLVHFTGLIPISAVPSTLVVDAHGLITARVIGRVDPTTLSGLIHDALAETSTSRASA